MSKRTNEADIAAVTDIVRAYYDGSMEGDEAKLTRRFIRAPASSATSTVSCTGRPSTICRRVQEGGRGSGTLRMADRWPLDRGRYRPGQAREPVCRRVVQRRSVHAPDRRRLADRPQTFYPHPGS